MPKNEKKRDVSLTRQKRALLLLEWAVGCRPAGSVWVMLLALRGFSLVEIGLAESVFHVVSLCCELPSGLLADVLGRKRTLLASQAMFLLSALLMAASEGMGGVYLSLAVSAMGFNLESGTREAISYESMLQVGREGEYLRFSAWQNGVYRFSDGGAMLLAGLTVALGWRTAYLLDAGIALAPNPRRAVAKAPYCACGSRTAWSGGDSPPGPWRRPSAGPGRCCARTARRCGSCWSTPWRGPAPR